MKPFSSLVLSLILFSNFAHASADLDFNFMIYRNALRLEIKQDFKLPIAQLRAEYPPNFLSKISNIVRSVKINQLSDSTSQIMINSKKHGMNISTVGTCNEKIGINEATSFCSLNLDIGDTSLFFSSGSENVSCNSIQNGTRCIFSMNAILKPLNYLVFYRSAELLALGGIMERIHDHAVLARVVNLNETAEKAKINFNQSNMSSCLDQMYKKYRKSAQKLDFNTQALEVHSSDLNCD